MIILAVALIDLSISFKIPVIYGLSFEHIFIGTAAGAAARILPIKRPLAMGLSKQFGMPKLSLRIKATRVFVSLGESIERGKWTILMNESSLCF